MRIFRKVFEDFWVVNPSEVAYILRILRKICVIQARCTNIFLVVNPSDKSVREWRFSFGQKFSAGVPESTISLVFSPYLYGVLLILFTGYNSRSSGYGDQKKFLIVKISQLTLTGIIDE